MVTFISYVEIWRSIPILTIVLLISIIVIYKAAVKIDSTRGEEFHKKDETEDTITASMKNLIDTKKNQLLLSDPKTGERNRQRATNDERDKNIGRRDDFDENATSDNNTWRCACESGFLPPGLLKSFGGMESMMRMGTGQCYHKP